MRRVSFRSPRRQAVWRKTSGGCFYCGLQLVGDGLGYLSRYGGTWLPVSSSWMEIEHKEPRCKGGSNRQANLEPACGSCNARKGGKTVHEYRRWLMKKNGGELVLFHGEVCS